MPATETPPPYPYQHQRIRFKDPDSGKTLVFLTNNMLLPPPNIAALYKSRWQIELFFKWIKQHLRIRKFLGASENTAKTPIWCAVSTYVLLAIVKKELQLDASLYTLLQILSVSVFEETEISCARLFGHDPGSGIQKETTHQRNISSKQHLQNKNRDHTEIKNNVPPPVTKELA